MSVLPLLCTAKITLVQELDEMERVIKRQQAETKTFTPANHQSSAFKTHIIAETNCSVGALGMGS